MLAPPEVVTYIEGVVVSERQRGKRASSGARSSAERSTQAFEMHLWWSRGAARGRSVGRSVVIHVGHIILWRIDSWRVVRRSVVAGHGGLGKRVARRRGPGVSDRRRFLRRERLRGRSAGRRRSDTAHHGDTALSQEEIEIRWVSSRF